MQKLGYPIRRVPDDLGRICIPEAMHIGATFEESDLLLVPSFVVVVADVHRHVHVLDAIDQKTQGKAPMRLPEEAAAPTRDSPEPNGALSYRE